MAAKAAPILAFLCVLALAGWAVSASANDALQGASAKAKIETSMLPPSGDSKCAALKRVALADTLIVSASVQPAQLPVTGAVASDDSGRPGSVSGLPAFCRVVGRIHPEPGSDIRFEVWLPTEDWDGRYMGVGNGGFAGSINYKGMAAAISVGQASASTDTGHVGSNDAAWARGNPAKVRDYGWRAMHLTAVNAKGLINAYYGRPADKSYFQSCSNGGRQGLMEASRFPEDYDGILAGSPAAQMTNLIMAVLWNEHVQRPAGAAIRPEQIQHLQDEVLTQCDSLDGQSDRLVDDPRNCRVNVAKLSCDASNSPQCFSGEQVDALRQIYEGPPKLNGQTVALAFPPSGAEVGRPVSFLGWERWIAGGGEEPLVSAIYPRGLLEDMVTPPITPVEAFNWKTDPPKLIAALGDVLDVQPDMKEYFARGGKLIMYHGWADAAIPPQQTIEFYNAILEQSGRESANSVRLFMIPGMQHCYGGTGAELFGQMSAPSQSARPENNISMALQYWVERGQAPVSVVGTKGFPLETLVAPDEQQRLHCAFPMQAVLTPGTDPDKATNYTCHRSDPRD
jgi:feruloyl esterase